MLHYHTIQRPAAGLRFLKILSISLIALLWSALAVRAQSPSSIGGRTFELTVAWSLPGSGLAPAGSKFRFLPSEVDSRYDVVPISASVSPSTGTYSYQQVDSTRATLTQSDEILAASGTVNCTFSSPTSAQGTYRTYSSGIEVQNGSFVMSAAASPAGIAGSLITVTVTSGQAPFAGAGSVYRVRPDAAGNYTIEGTSTSSGAFTSDGTYSYTKNPNYTGRVVYQNDRLVGSGFTSKLFFNSTTTGTVTLIHQGGWASGYQTGTFTFAPNTAPTIGSIPNATINEDAQTSALGFTVNDAQTLPAALTLSATGSSNQTVIPLSGVTFGSSGGNPTVTVQPAQNQFSTSPITITVTVTDGGGLTAQRSFTVTVNPVNAPPTISNILDTSTNEDTATAAIPFTVSGAGSLVVTGSSSDSTLVPNANLTFGGSGGSRTLTVMPALNRFGSTTITVTVTDGGGLTASDSFVLTVNPVNDPPVISAIASQTTSVGVPTGAISFTVGDVETAPASLNVGKASGNVALVPVDNILFGGTGAGRTVTITPTAGQTGFADVTLTVSDGQATAFTTFRLTVVVPLSIAKGAIWKYLAPLTAASAPASNWNTIGYADTSWGSGTAPIGFGGDGEVTAIPIAAGKPFTVYFRKKITVAGAAGIPGLRLNLRRDDGAVVYLNGIEKWRSNMPEGVSISYDTPARSVVGGTNETTYFTREVTAAGLVEGDNLVAVEVHQYDAASSDIGFDLEIIPLNYAPNSPPWVSNIGDRTLAPGASTGATAFTVGDGETAAGSLSVTAASSNPGVIPVGNIAFGGSGGNRTIAVTAPAAGQAGSSLITVTVSDGRLSSATSFVVTVTSSVSSVRLAAWGDNDRGQLGNNSTTDSNNPVAVSFSGALAAKSPVHVATGEAHSLVLFSDGTMAAWGRNDEGQLGTGNLTSSLVPVVVPMNGALSGKSVVAISAGRYHSIALCSDSTISCWGNGGYGQLGNNGTANSSTPVSVLNTGVLSGKVVISVAAGSYHNLALTSDGMIASWGYNADGALGNGSTSYSAVPVSVTRTGAQNPLVGRTVTAIAAGGTQSLALCSDGTLAAWGDNQYGQLGNGGTSDSSIPIQVNRTGVLAARTPTAIAVGTFHCLAACSDGRVVAWGYNGSRQLGDNTNSDRYTPVLVNNTGVLSGRIVDFVAAGLYGSAAICTDGTAAEWGDTNTPVPAAFNVSGILPGRTIFDVAAGSFYKVALTSPVPAPFRVTTMSRIAAGDVFIGFPTLEGVPYHIEWSDTLGVWARWGTVNGNGAELITRLPSLGGAAKRYFRAVAGQ